MKQKSLLFVFFVFPLGLFILAACVDFDAITINNPDLGKVADGTYRGNSKVGPVRVVLDVIVRDRAITSIQIIEHFNGRGEKAETIVPRIIEAQSLEVDVVSGATGSSKAILKAVETALTP
ncbi:MAG: FMN-binding protein [Treponema sp.]|jgi:uncharacterized protein with FMN-binding domain|nr:FMN-binding protein [Treponema sp.]